MKTILFPHEEFPHLRDVKFYIPAGSNPWDGGMTIYGHALEQCEVKITKVDQITRPFHGRDNFDRHFDFYSLMAEAEALEGHDDEVKSLRAAAWDRITGAGIYCEANYGGVKSSFYIARDPVSPAGKTPALYAQSQVTPWSSNYVRVPSYHMMTEQPYNGYAALWRMKIYDPAFNPGQGGGLQTAG